MTPEEQLALVKRAIQLGQTVTGCCEWHEQAYRRVSRDGELSSWTPETIRKLVIEFVLAGGIIRQVKETRPECTMSTNSTTRSSFRCASFRKGSLSSCA